MKIHVHVGAHKTATTFLQDTLAANLPELRQEGIGYLPLDVFRPQITVRVLYLEPSGERPEKFLPQFFGQEAPPSDPRLIFSDENLVGSCVNILDGNTPFLNGPERLRALGRFLSDYEVTMFFAIRSYDTFIASAYCEALRWGPQFVDFSTIRKKLKPDAFDWPSIIENFVECLNPAKVRIWRFEDFQKRPDDVLRALAFNYAGTLKKAPNWSVRPSFSQRAIDSLGNIARTAGTEAAARMIKMLEQTMPKRNSDDSFYPWTDGERDTWRAKYSADCARIEENDWLPLAR